MELGFEPIIPIIPKFPNDPNAPTRSLNLRHAITDNGKRKTDAAERVQRELANYRGVAVGGLHSKVKMDKQKRYLSKNYLQNIFFLYLCS